MSTEWTNEKHRAARVLGNNAPRKTPDDFERAAALHQALDEIERLRSLARAALRSALNPEEGEQA